MKKQQYYNQENGRSPLKMNNENSENGEVEVSQSKQKKNRQMNPALSDSTNFVKYSTKSETLNQYSQYPKKKAVPHLFGTENTPRIQTKPLRVEQLNPRVYQVQSDLHKKLSIQSEEEKVREKSFGEEISPLAVMQEETKQSFGQVGFEQDVIQEQQLVVDLECPVIVKHESKAVSEKRKSSRFNESSYQPPVYNQNINNNETSRNNVQELEHTNPFTNYTDTWTIYEQQYGFINSPNDYFSIFKLVTFYMFLFIGILISTYLLYQVVVWIFQILGVILFGASTVPSAPSGTDTTTTTKSLLLF